MGQPAYEWGLVVIAAAVVAVGSYGLGSLVRAADTPIITIINY
jgi:hypothetical protein